MKERMIYAEALARANELVARLAPVCERIEIAGSLRRKQPEVGDIELVAIPRCSVVCDLLGEPIVAESVNLLDVELGALSVEFSKNGERYKQFAWRGMTVDLFLPTVATWGAIFTIRTGSADFSKWLMTPRFRGGAAPLGCHFVDGRVWQGVVLLRTPEETDVFEALGEPWLEPAARTAGLWGKYLRKEAV